MFKCPIRPNTVAIPTVVAMIGIIVPRMLIENTINKSNITEKPTKTVFIVSFGITMSSSVSV